MVVVSLNGPAIASSTANVLSNVPRRPQLSAAPAPAPGGPPIKQQLSERPSPDKSLTCSIRWVLTYVRDSPF